MDIRKEIGNRVVGVPVARSSETYPAYLIACACFYCRKSFKKPIEGLNSACPQCGKQLYEMGRSFSAPKMNDQEQWAKVECLWKAGFRFSGSGSHDGPAFPDRLKDVGEFISKNPNHPLKVASE